jgi:hypothetical protein
MANSNGFKKVTGKDFFSKVGPIKAERITFK